MMFEFGHDYKFSLYFLNHVSILVTFNMHVSNELNFWNVYGIMNTSGLLQSK